MAAYDKVTDQYEQSDVHYGGSQFEIQITHVLDLDEMIRDNLPRQKFYTTVTLQRTPTKKHLYHMVHEGLYLTGKDGYIAAFAAIRDFDVSTVRTEVESVEDIPRDTTPLGPKETEELTYEEDES